jgi:hypothetical protein
LKIFNDDIIEKKQFAVDGDERLNVSLPSPIPFESRPPIGVRLYIKGNVKRFLHALVAELTNWQTPTRLKSAKLLNIVLFLCEDHLTIEAHTLLPSFVKALRYADSERDRELAKAILDAVEMYGRYTSFPVYLHILQPYLADVEEEVKKRAVRVLAALLEGSKSSQVVIHFHELVAIALPLLDDLLLRSQEETSSHAAGQAEMDLYRILLKKFPLVSTDLPLFRNDDDDGDGDGGYDSDAEKIRTKYLMTMQALHEIFNGF